jgi:hypothetical protein
MLALLLLAQSAKSVDTATASGDDDKVITIKQVATLGIIAADYTGLTKQFTERTMAISMGFCSTKCTSYTAGYTMASAAARRA